MSNKETQVFRTNSQKEKGVTEGASVKQKGAKNHANKTRELHDNHQTATAGQAKHIEVEFGKPIETELEIEPEAVPEALEAAAPQSKPAPRPKLAPEPEMNFEAKDAAPWALSIHLEERIKSLGAITASVNKQIDELDTSVKNLKKRTGL